MIGNRSVARLIPNSDERFPQYHWLSVIDGDEFPDHGWHAVDFETLEIAQYNLRAMVDSHVQRRDVQAAS